MAVFDGGQPGSMPQWNWWTQGPVQRTYDGGKFTYYQVFQESLPCDGPGCRGSKPDSTFKSVALVDSHRSTWCFDRTPHDGLPAEARRRLVSSDQRAAAPPTLDGPLRPPCA